MRVELGARRIGGDEALAVDRRQEKCSRMGWADDWIAKQAAKGEGVILDEVAAGVQGQWFIGWPWH